MGFYNRFFFSINCCVIIQIWIFRKTEWWIIVVHLQGGHTGRLTWELCIYITRIVHSSFFIIFCCGLVSINFNHILQGYFTDPGAIIWLPQGEWSNVEVYGRIICIISSPELWLYDKIKQNKGRTGNHVYILWDTLYPQYFSETAGSLQLKPINLKYNKSRQF